MNTIDQTFEDIKSSISRKDEEAFLELLVLLKGLMNKRYQSNKNKTNNELFSEINRKLKEVFTEIHQTVTIKDEPSLKAEKEENDVVVTAPVPMPPPPPPPPPLPPTTKSVANFRENDLNDLDKRPKLKMKLLRWSKLNLANLKFIENQCNGENVWTIKKFPDLKKVDSDFNLLENLFSQCDISKNYSFYTRTILHRLQKNFNESKRMDMIKFNSPDMSDSEDTIGNMSIISRDLDRDMIGCKDGEGNDLELLMMSGINSFKDRKTNTRKLMKDTLYSEIQSRSLLSNQRCLNINIFLSQFKQFDMSLLHLLQSNRSNIIGAERLKGLVKLLPTEDEEKILKLYKGHICLLDPAEQFFVQLVKMNRFRERIDNMLLIEEFHTSVQHMKPLLKKIQDTTEALINSEELCKILQLILYIGNFINGGEGLGSASGFKISSLLKLSEVKSNNMEFTLLHFLAQEIEDHYKDLFRVEEQFVFMKDVSEVAFDQLKKDFNILKGRVMSMKESIDFLPEKLHDSVKEFLATSLTRIDELQKQFDNIKLSFNKLADYFCEDHKHFKPEECFRTLHLFLEQLKRSRQENFDRKQRELRSSSLNRSKNFRALSRNNQNPMVTSSFITASSPTPSHSCTISRIRSSSLKNIKQESFVRNFTKDEITKSPPLKMNYKSSTNESQRISESTSLSTVNRKDVDNKIIISKTTEDTPKIRIIRSHSVRMKNKEITLKGRERILKLPDDAGLKDRTEICDSGIEDLSEKSRKNLVESLNTKLSSDEEQGIKENSKVPMQDKEFLEQASCSKFTDSSDEEDKETLDLKRRLNMTLKNVNETEIKLTHLNGETKERIVKNDFCAVGQDANYLHFDDMNEDEANLNRQLNSYPNTGSPRRKKGSSLFKAASFLNPSLRMRYRNTIHSNGKVCSTSVYPASNSEEPDLSNHESNIILRTYSKYEPQKTANNNRLAKVCL